jgi:hypothetical protein
VDGFVLILAIIVFSVFRNVISEAKKKQNQESLPDVLDTIAEHDEAQEHALDALRQWEARQRALKAGRGEADPGSRDSVRIPRPGEDRADVRLPASRRKQSAAGRESRPFELAHSRGPEQTRREAYDAIRELLAGQANRPAPPVPARTEPTRERGQVPDPSAAPKRIRDRAPASRPRIRGTVQRQTETGEPSVQPAGTRRTSSEAAPAGLGRLESLPPVARGILYAELLGKPVAFRGPGEGGRD